MNKNRTFWIIILILTSNIINAQSDFRPGYYITNNNDTVYGLIDYRGEMRNSKLCVFKKNDNAEALKFKPGEIFSYRFSKGKYYISRTISHKNGDKKLFLEYVLNGVSDLFFYRDGQSKGDHYLIEMKDGQLVELRNDEIKTNINGKKGVKQSKKHVGVLKVAFSDCQEIQPRIEQTKLSHKSLINLTKKYHNYVCEGEACIVYEKKPTKIELKFAPFIGIKTSALELEDNHNILNISHEKQIQPSFGLLFDLLLPGANQKYSIQLSTEFSKCEFNNDVNLAGILPTTIKTSFINLENSIALKYNYPRGRFRPNIGIGGVLNLALNQNSERVTEFNSSATESEEFKIKSPILGPFIQIGCNYHLNEKVILFGAMKYSTTSGKHIIEPFGADKANQRTLKSKYNSLSISIGMYF